ncbi:putative fatty acyl-CoA reductase CG5065 isoform X2 [Culex pipiens pallens]|nr:putative fatty acyl-CoA reductase CG5065 isoform X2 [Culex pipiens pallens]
MDQPSPPPTMRRSIPETYAGRTLFITGATGFMGKVLVEKLLRDCPELKCIYLLIRTKRGVDAAQRKDEYLKHLVFDRIRETNRAQLDKIRLVRGDILEDDLDMANGDQAELAENVEVVFHCAANVRFDQELKQAVNYNLNGTLRVLRLAERMKRLVAFVHVSTAFCQCNEAVVEERAYPAPHSPLGISKLADLVDSKVLDLVTPSMLNDFPDTYSYTKALTEDLVNGLRDRLPIAIARPTIVTAAWKEPVPGWIEGTHGPTGLIIGCGRGVVRTMHCNPDYDTHVMPVDVTMNAVIILGAERINAGLDGKALFCNISSDYVNPIAWGKSVQVCWEKVIQNPLCFSLWYPDGSIKSNSVHHMICAILFHYLPAYLIDFLLVVFRREPFLLNNLPNTYAYTKALTEDLVNGFRDRLPVAIARPTVVIAAWREPIPGWIEGTHGPTGLMIGGGRGVIRTMHCNPEYDSGLMPVDVTMNGVIILGAERINTGFQQNTLFCNIASGNVNPITWGDALEAGRKKLYDNPLCFSLWYPDGSIKSNYLYHMLCVVLFHYLPAYLIDFLLIILRRKPFMIKIQKKISQGLNVLQYYTTKQWVFNNDRMCAMYGRLSEKDRQTFFFDMSALDWPSYFRDYILGVRQYVLKEPPATLPKARRLLRKLYIMDKLVQAAIYALILWLVWSYWDVVIGSIQFVLDSSVDGVRKTFARGTRA